MLTSSDGRKLFPIISYVAAGAGLAARAKEAREPEEPERPERPEERPEGPGGGPRPDGQGGSHSHGCSLDRSRCRGLVRRGRDPRTLGGGERGEPFPWRSGELTLYADLSPTTVSTVYPDNLAAVYTAPRRPDGRHWVRGSPLWVAGGYRGPDGGTDLHFRKK